MLKLILFAPCEKILTTKEESTSLIAVLEALKVQPKGEVPADAVAQLNWAVVALYNREHDVEDTEYYVQRCDVVRPDKTVVTQGVTTFQVTNKFFNFRNELNLNLFPVGQDGLVIVRLYLRKATAPDDSNPDDPNWGEPIAEFPIRLIIGPQEASEEEKAADAKRT